MYYSKALCMTGVKALITLPFINPYFQVFNFALKVGCEQNLASSIRTTVDQMIHNVNLTDMTLFLCKSQGLIYHLLSICNVWMNSFYKQGQPLMHFLSG